MKFTTALAAVAPGIGSHEGDPKNGLLPRGADRMCCQKA